MAKMSSKLVEDLLSNEVWSFWKGDWSEGIIVDWSSRVKRDCFFNDISRLLGEGFIYERSLSGIIEYMATENGLVKI